MVRFSNDTHHNIIYMKVGRVNSGTILTSNTTAHKNTFVSIFCIVCFADIQALDNVTIIGEDLFAKCTWMVQSPMRRYHPWCFERKMDTWRLCQMCLLPWRHQHLPIHKINLIKTKYRTSYTAKLWNMEIGVGGALRSSYLSRKCTSGFQRNFKIGLLKSTFPTYM